MFEWLWTLIKIPTAALVRGDIVYIKGGDKVPVMTEMIKTSRLIKYKLFFKLQADVCLIHSAGLKVMLLTIFCNLFH